MSELNKLIEELRQFASDKNWEGVLGRIEDSAESSSTQIDLFKAHALLKLDRGAESKSLLETALNLNPFNEWAINLYYEFLEKDLGQPQAVSFLRSHIIKNSIVSEPLLVKCADTLRLLSRYTEAIEINKRRASIAKPSRKIAIAIQTFNKADTLKGLLDSLLKCEFHEHFSIVVLQDSWKDSKREDVFEHGYNEVKILLQEYMPALVERFGAFEYITNEKNLGTAPSCVKLLNFVCEKYTSFIFFEDDCILFEDTLKWSKFAIENLIDQNGAHFATCESVFFDFGKKQKPTEDDVKNLMEVGGFLNNNYCTLNFVPSTNFISTRQIWKQYRNLRCLPRGPESLNSYFKEYNGKCIFPIVPRTVDVGMEHELGYSTTNLGKGNVKEIKNTFVNSSLYDSSDRFAEYEGDTNLLYSASSNIHGPHIAKLLNILKNDMN